MGSDADALGVVGGVENAAGRLGRSELPSHLLSNNPHLHEVQHSRSWDRHLCAMNVALGGVAEFNSSRIWLGMGGR